jgi:hypothetical protein
MNKKSSSRRPYPEAGQKSEAPSRVAEPATAVYSPTKPSAIKKSLRSPMKQIAGYDVSTEVWQFVVDNDLAPHLETAIRLVRACFPTVRKIDFEYVIDPEVKNNSWIDLAIKVSGTVEEVLTQMNRFDEEMIKLVPIEKGAKLCLSVGGL